MSLVVPGHGVVVDPQVPQRSPMNPWVAPPAAGQGGYPPGAVPPQDQHQQIMDYLFQQLRAQYPGVPESDLREAAKKLFMEIRAKQGEDFNRKFFPERLPAQQPQGPAAQYSPPPPGPQAAPDLQAQQQQVKMKQIADAQEAFAKQQAQNQANYHNGLVNSGRWTPGGPPKMGQAQPIQAQDTGTPYNPAGPDKSQQMQQMTDQEIAQKNAEAAAMMMNPGFRGFGTQYRRNPDGSVGIIQ